MSFFKKKVANVEDPPIMDECIPNLSSLIGGNKSINKDLFYMFWRIKESGMADALIHLEPNLTKWWDKLWKDYDDQIRRQKLLNQLTELLKDNFTSEQLEDLSKLENFIISPEREESMTESPF
ncbi:hypothetical protein KC622_03035 [Candidatus Dojkabacteria bacterium]|uniref:Uncharacterized protein n=1 Tax=Candidatus Dojkabacteria bacterium TaxID=2099670 RepID=A0A955HZ65_9BACT|nr:hypothetical protein [Candidatus Dojkabacteria bacterium]